VSAQLQLAGVEGWVGAALNLHRCRLLLLLLLG
jgi:hypothetical protein